MKFKHLYIAAIAIGIGFAAPVLQAATYTVDTFIGSANLGNSGDATELNALKALLGPSGSNLVMDYKSSGSVTAVADGAGQWYLDVTPDQPGYFLLKFGTGGLGGVNDTYFFENIGEMTKLVWTNAQVNNITGGCGANNCNIGRLSHYAYTNGTGTDNIPTIPEPGVLSLMGIGLLGFGARKINVKR
ncbi:PEP-CTERM sorting domain-containing protein [Methylomonas sp. EFPC3]|uniref:PEP-CTERM sorting domain-containing protein n=1 Tax=Methylomonas sp. EFPC3 TaxID=3021710 RepID=UPI002417670E|nr:PEP-CTERM sorting domain-containing protein [Methylomonas sp. EFPC3]WFP50848.1 PEP-CTERM sorting domain-containing protein [Methylomonas sp. EFPC3]